MFGGEQWKSSSVVVLVGVVGEVSVVTMLSRLAFSRLKCFVRTIFPAPTTTVRASCSSSELWYKSEATVVAAQLDRH